jgi:aryl-alcohol dehydrogenase-like predicted oxidoreductase
VRSATLGTTGPTISRLGIGGWQAGGSGPWGAGANADDDQAIAAIRRAVECGVGWVDTAASYGFGHSEELVRRALEPWCVGEEVLVFTKCGHPWESPDRIWTELSGGSIRRECEGSLRRLGVDRIDLYQFHHPDPSTPVEESWTVMDELVQAGKVRWAGVSNFDVPLLDRCEAVRHVDTIQPELSLLRPEARRDVIPWARRHDAGVLVYSPIGGGMLAGTFDRERLASLPADDSRRREADVIANFIDKLTAIAARASLDLMHLALGWALSVEGVTAAICGARTEEQVDGWIRAADEPLDASTLAEVESVARRVWDARRGQ